LKKSELANTFTLFTEITGATKDAAVSKDRDSHNQNPFQSHI